MAEQPVFRNATNVRFLKAIFLEHSYTDRSNVIYTLKDQDHDGYPSLYRLYMELEDVTEYDFANAYLENYDHWEMLCKCGWFQPFLARWRKELDLKLKTEAVRVIRQELKDPASKNKFQAAKMIIDRVWELRDPKVPPKRGRPPKVDEESDEDRISNDEKMFLDLQRITSKGE